MAGSAPAGRPDPPRGGPGRGEGVGDPRTAGRPAESRAPEHDCGARRRPCTVPCTCR